ncbi:MAG: HDIG domain-containing protein [bacterium]|nr:HDIG domain-containing protein [bacterium]
MLKEKLKDRLKKSKIIFYSDIKEKRSESKYIKLILSLIVFLTVIILPETFKLMSILGRILLVSLFVLLSGIYIYLFQPKIFKSETKLLITGLILVVSFVMIKLLFWLDISIYLVPGAIIGILLSTLLKPNLAFFISSLAGILIGLMKDNTLNYSFFLLLTNWIGIFSVFHLRKRISIPLAGLILGVGNSVLILIINLIGNHYSSFKTLQEMGWGFLGGLLAISLSGILLIVFENIFNLTTDIRMIELTDLNHPLLKNLALVAPGTYHHSIVVGNLAEAGAESIGANSLLARASAYFHDIGKLNKAKYFSENNSTKIHDKLTPNMSSLILISHVKDGVDLADQYRLSEGVVNIIREHHGTSLVSFFYQEALKENPSENLSEQNYRYPGPKPQSKEAGIVMLADIVEAASRTLTNPTPNLLKSLINRLINEKLKDSQLDECELSLRDITKITQVFERVLSGIYHSRVDYPKTEDLVDENIDKQLAKVSQIAFKRIKNNN